MNKQNRKRQCIDLHMHSTNSDGEQSPDEVIRQAKAAGMSLISITDHNRFTFTECMQYEGMTIVPGIEFSSAYCVPAWNEITEIHVVGIFPNGVDVSDFDEILADIDEGKEAYVTAILADLETRGIHITMEEVKKAERKHEQIGRHEIAKVLVEKGLETDMDAAFDHQIGNFSPYYIPSTRYIRYAPMEKVVQQIKASGGIPILAHPYGYSMEESEIEQLIVDFSREVNAVSEDAAAGRSNVAAMEIYYQKYLSNCSRMDFLKRMQKKYGLLASAASDRHRADQPFCSGGDLSLFDNMVSALKDGSARV